MFTRYGHAFVLAPALLVVAVQAGCGMGGPRSTLPASLSAPEFWSLTAALSEAPGAFTHSDNLVSNEIHLAQLVRMARQRGGVYIGVGPEQNFSYIARLRPEMAFIVDIRTENRSLHLMYKALFELSTDRADFISRLFSRERPPGLDRGTSVHDLFAQYGSAAPSRQLYEATAKQIRGRLLDSHKFPLAEGDLAWIDYALNAFYADGPEIHYARLRPADKPGPSYRALMTAEDAEGQPRSYLAQEDGFAFLKDLHARNLIVPIVGDFAGQRALRGTADYVRLHRGIVQAFYSSNVEVYLNRRQMAAFCSSLAMLPYGRHTRLIDSKTIQPFALKLRSCAPAAVK